MIRFETSETSNSYYVLYETNVPVENDEGRVRWVGRNDGMPWSLPPSNNISPIIVGIEGNYVIIDTCDQDIFPPNARFMRVGAAELGLSVNAILTLYKLFNSVCSSKKQK